MHGRRSQSLCVSFKGQKHKDLNFRTGVLESETNGTIGQFAKRSIAAPLEKRQNIPYPSNEAVIEQERVSAETVPFLESVPAIVSGVLLPNTPYSPSALEQVLFGAIPNPFFGSSISGINAEAASQEQLLLVDGSEIGQENPLWPVIQPARNLDMAIVSDSGGTELSSGWLNGTSLYNTYLLAQANNIPFPKLPNVITMLNKGYTSKPTVCFIF